MSGCTQAQVPTAVENRTPDGGGQISSQAAAWYRLRTVRTSSVSAG